MLKSFKDLLISNKFLMFGTKDSHGITLWCVATTLFCALDGEVGLKGYAE